MAIPVYEFTAGELLFYLGLSLFFGYFTSILLEKVGVPNVVVYLLTGFVVGNFFIPGLYETESLEYWNSVIESTALGLIGFKVGTEMHLAKMKSDTFLLFMIIVGQVVFSFGFVFIAAMIVFDSFILALIFGGLATASAPAATIEIIRKFKAEGPLTSRIAWSLAMIDVVAVMIVEAILIYTEIELLGEELNLLHFAEVLGQEIGFAILFGLLAGFALDLIIERLNDNLQMMEISLAILILAIGFVQFEFIEASVILTTITIGAVTVNREGEAYEEVVDILEIIMSPVLIVFFVLVGSKVRLELFAPGVFPFFAITFFLFRAAGKIIGSYVGASIGKGSDNVKKYLGLGMIPQGGLVLGLITVANRILTDAGRSDIGDLVVIVIILATLFSEAFGSFGAVFALGKAGELNQKLAGDNPIAANVMDEDEINQDETNGDKANQEEIKESE